MERETSGMLFSYYSKSQYHERCVPADVNKTADTTGKSQTGLAVPTSDVVSNDKMWRQAVEQENKIRRGWKTNWGFLADYDPQGNLKERSPLPQESTVFSTKVPNTNAGNYGGRLQTDLARNMLAMEHRLQAHNRKKKMDKEVVCY